MIAIKKIKTSDKDYSFVESLIESAFPIDERRDRVAQREYTDTNENFVANIILHDDKPVGLINYWFLGPVYYIEHFAISPSMRNRGYGEMALDKIKKILCDKPIILEVELPVGDIEKRRINFYQRNGFILNELNYIQPPYRENGDCLDMKLMSYNLDKTIDINYVVNKLYKQVYNYSKVS